MKKLLLIMKNIALGIYDFLKFVGLPFAIIFAIMFLIWFIVEKSNERLEDIEENLENLERIGDTLERIEEKIDKQ